LDSNAPFWIATHRFGTFFNFSGHAFMLDGARWPSVEHCYQAQKFEDEAFRERIRLWHTPREAKKSGRSNGCPLALVRTTKKA